MIEVASTLDGTPKQIKKDHAYLVDFSKLNSVNDLILVLSAMGISFPGNHPFIEQIKPFLNLDNPFPLEGPKKAEFIPLKKN
jgi:hypothetical protein